MKTLLALALIILALDFQPALAKPTRLDGNQTFVENTLTTSQQDKADLSELGVNLTFIATVPQQECLKNGVRQARHCGPANPDYEIPGSETSK